MKEQPCGDDRRRMEWIECRLGQLGIDVRQSGLHRQMHYYLELLNQQIAITREFLEEDGAAGRPSGWAGWSKVEIADELRRRMAHFYGQTDGTMRFPNSAEGDLLKMVHHLFGPNAAGSPTGADNQGGNDGN